MAVEFPETPRLKDLNADLERTLIDDYLRGLGYNPEELRDRDDAQAHLLLVAAATYAAAKLTEVESRAKYVHDIHGS